MRVHLFNPENDINLAYGHDTPRLSPMVRALAHDGRTLPLWYAHDCDKIVMHDVDERWLGKICSDFGIEAKPYMGETGLAATPWGWSIQTARNLRSLGLETLSDRQIDAIRNLSHRRASIFIADRLGTEPPVEATTVNAIQDFIDAHNGDAYIKAPWSSSGRGVFRAKNLLDSDIAQIKSIIRRQGCVILERAHDRKLDFALLFESTGSTVKMRGYSLFLTSAHGEYSGNFISTDNEILHRLEESGANISRLQEIGRSLESILKDYVAGVYAGWMGIDMILCHDGTIVPCIELNLRMTMGVVAKLFGERWLAPDQDAMYKVALRTQPTDYTYNTHCNRLVNGTLRLNIPSDTSGFDFTVTVDSDKRLQFTI